MARIQFNDHYYEGEVNEKGEPHGQGARYYNDGNILKCTFINGKANGPAIADFTNGERLEVNYTDDHMNGPCKWYLGRILVCEGDYLNGKRTGYWVYEQNGLHSEGTYRDGLRNGHWVIEAYGDGSVSEYEYVDGKRNGPGIEIQRDGFCSAGEFRDDEENGRWIDNFPDGTYQYGEYMNGLQEGYWITYHASGDITRQRFHKGWPKGKIEILTKEGDRIDFGLIGNKFTIKGTSSKGMKVDMTLDENASGSARIEDKDGTKVSGAYHEGKEYGQWSVSDKEGSAELDLTGGRADVIEYKEKKKGFLSRLFGKKS